MPGINDSKSATKPISDTSRIAPSSASREQQRASDRHVSVPSFGYQAPDAATSKLPPPRSTAKPPNALSDQAGPARPMPEAFRKAEVAGRAATKRMEELQGDATKLTRPFLYPNYGYPSPSPNAPAQSAVAPSATALTASASRPAAEIAEQKRVRLHKLFNTWVPGAVEFYNVYDTLDLTAEEVKAIQDEVVRYRIESAHAVGKHTPYNAEWEAAPPHLSPPRRAGGNATGEDKDDLSGLGLPRAVLEESRRAEEARNLLD